MTSPGWHKFVGFKSDQVLLSYEITVTSVTGTLIGSAVVDGAVLTGVVNTGESWTPRGGVKPISPELLKAIQEQLAAAWRGIQPPVVGGPDLHLVIHVNPQTGSQEPPPSTPAPPPPPCNEGD